MCWIMESVSPPKNAKEPIYDDGVPVDFVSFPHSIPFTTQISELTIRWAGTATARLNPLETW